MMRESSQLAFVLHIRPLSENKQIVELFTEQLGRVSTASFISQGKKSDKSALLQPFTPVNVVIYGSSSLKKLKQVEAGNARVNLQKQALYCGFYLNELLVRLLPEQNACPVLFERYVRALSQLERQLELAPILRAFEMSLLDELGQAIDFNPVFDNDYPHFYYLAEQGFVPAIERKSQPYFHQTLLQAIANDEVESKEAQQTFKLLMRQVLSILLGDKPLHSRKFFN